LFSFQPEKASKDGGAHIAPHIQGRIEKIKRFRKWVTSEVLPQIRRTGSYSIQVPKTLPEALRAYAAEVEQHEKLKLVMEVQAPKVALADQCLIAVNSRSMGDTAKVLGVGRNTLFQILRDEGMLMQTNIPYQKYISIGWFEVKITPKVQHDVTVNYPVTMVLPKGLDKIRGILNRKEAT
jgi:phage antirepressor YoqD-like protein